MWGRYLKIGGVWCGSVSRRSPRLIMSGRPNGRLCSGWAPSDKSPPNFLSVLWTGMVSGDLSEFLVVNSNLSVGHRQIDLCKRIKKKKLLERQRKCASWQLLCFVPLIRSVLRLDSLSFNICCCVCAVSPYHSVWLGLFSPVPPEALISCLKSAELDKGRGWEPTRWLD